VNHPYRRGGNRTTRGINYRARDSPVGILPPRWHCKTKDNQEGRNEAQDPPPELTVTGST
jgi:hypothetical protein